MELKWQGRNCCSPLSGNCRCCSHCESATHTHLLVLSMRSWCHFCNQHWPICLGWRTDCAWRHSTPSCLSLELQLPVVVVGQPASDGWLAGWPLSTCLLWARRPAGSRLACWLTSNKRIHLMSQPASAKSARTHTHWGTVSRKADQLNGWVRPNRQQRNWLEWAHHLFSFSIIRWATQTNKLTQRDAKLPSTWPLACSFRLQLQLQK